MNNSYTWQDFVKTANKIAQKENFPASVILGQAAVETGRDMNNAPGFNAFGIKGGNGPALDTWEVSNGVPYRTKSQFQSYGSPEEAIEGYINLIKTSFPQAYALKNNPEAMVQAIAQGGYASDPQYAQKVLSTPEFQNPSQAGKTAEKTPNILSAELQQQSPSFQNLIAPQALAAEPETPLNKPNYAPNNAPQPIYEGPTLSNAPGMVQGGWYGSRQFWNGQLGAPGQIINPNQQGFGNIVSQEVMRQTNPANTGYVQKGGGITSPGYQNYQGSSQQASQPQSRPALNYSPVPQASMAPNTSTRNGPVYTPPPADHLVSPVYQRNFTPVPNYSPVPQTSNNIMTGGGLDSFA